ncbi:MAG: peptide chain release factor N(5)-glutamine methyltransferase [Hyphomicrobiaceae bacterium]|nr:peptide chain release factor N(5)-glutamine methyltransferase [Hyphomicrobiaceae bacterium]
MTEDAAPTHLRACCRNVIRVLEKVGVDTPELDARLMISDALGFKGAAYFIEPDRLLSEQELNEIAQRLTRRMAGEPVSRILGVRSFWKHDFGLGEHTLDPRPDSETLIETALELLEAQAAQASDSGSELSILDLGTGSGALLISLLLELPHARGMGVDISPQALQIASKNAWKLRCADRVEFREGDWLDVFEEGEERFDLVICNPPYIPAEQIDGLAPEVAKFDPRLALDGGEKGLDPYQKIIPQLSKVLKSRGLAVFEIGEGQEQAVSELFLQAGYKPAGTPDGRFRDLAGWIRCLAFRAEKEDCHQD